MKTKNVPKVLKCTINHTFFSSQTWGSQTSPTYPFVFNCVTLWHCCAHVWTEQNSEFCGWCCPHIVKKKSSCVCNIIQSFRNLIGTGLWGVWLGSDSLVGNYTPHSSKTARISFVCGTFILLYIKFQYSTFALYLLIVSTACALVVTTVSPITRHLVLHFAQKLIIPFQ